VAIPNEIDPFTGRSATCVDKMIVCIDRWRIVWSQVLDEWRTSVVVRPTGDSMDRYWHPPGTATNCGLIRSPKNLQEFLDYSSQIQSKIGDDKPDFIKLLQEWNRR
jgi:hypothetical protein